MSSRLDLCTLSRNIGTGWIYSVASVLFPCLLRPTTFSCSTLFFLNMVFCDSFPVTAERHGSPELALIPRSAYRQRLFLCGPASFSSSTAYPGYPAHHRRTHIELDIIEGRGNQPFSGKGMHYEHLMPPLFLLSMLLGGAQLDLVSPAFGADDLFSILFFYISQKAIPFPLPYPSASSSLYVVFFKTERVTTGVNLLGRRNEKLADFIAHRWRS